MPSKKSTPNHSDRTSGQTLPCHHIVGLEDLFHLDSKSANETPDFGFPAGCTTVLSGPPGAGKTTFALGLVRSMLRGAEKDGTAYTEEDKPESKGDSLQPKHIAYFISTEVTRDRLKRMFETRGWFTDEDRLFKPNPDTGRTSGLHVINPPLEIERPVKSSEELVNFIVRQIAVQPPPRKGQLVFIVVDSITSLFKDTTGGDSRRQIFELVHRLQAQFSKSTDSGSQIGKLGMILLLSEQGIENMESPGLETYVADFVFTLGLKSLSMGTRLRTLEVTKSQGANMMMGTHTWHIVTSQSLPRLVAAKTLKKKVRDSVDMIEGRNPERKSGSEEKAEDSSDKAAEWGTIMVASRPSFYPFDEVDSTASHAGDPESSGICGLDEMLRFDPDYWFMDPLEVIKERRLYAGWSKDEREQKKDEGIENPLHTSIKAGNVTMLVGEPGTGKTSLCYHLVASHLAKNTSEPKGGPYVALLVGFEQDFSSSFKRFGERYFFTGGTKGLEKDAHFDNCEFIYRPRSGLHFNLLLLELREWLKAHGKKNKRVVIDGISHLASTHTRQEFSKMLDALVSLFAQHPKGNTTEEPDEQHPQEDKTQVEAKQQPQEDTPHVEGEQAPPPTVSKATLFLTYEAMQNDNSVLDSDTLRLPAHNIIRFSHMVIEDKRRTAVTVIKSSHPEYDNMVRELVLDHEDPAQTHISSGFDAYSRLLSGQVRKAEVVLQLFRENEKEEAYNQALKKHLNDLLPYRILLRDFSRFDITSALDGKSEHVKVPSGDVLVAHTDEWWLAHKVQVLKVAAEEARMLKKENPLTKEKPLPETEAWRRFRRFVADNQLTKLAGFVGTKADSPINPGDFWCFEMEKAWARGSNKEPDSMANEHKLIGPYGLPAYLDFGMLCVHHCFKAMPEDMPDCHTGYTSWNDYDQVPWERLTPNDQHKKARENYLSLLIECMAPWCEESTWTVQDEKNPQPVEKEWFKSSREVGEKVTLVNLMWQHLETQADGANNTGDAEAKGDAEENKDKASPAAGFKKLPYGFAWDSRTPETAACFLYELAWAFGGSFDLFAEDDEMKNRRPVRRALSFIGFLVHEGLMPPCPTLTDTAQSVFSRHYFSTYVDVVSRYRDQKQKAKKAPDKTDPQAQGQDPQPVVTNPVLVSLGFMPPGPKNWQSDGTIIEDRKKRREKLTERTLNVDQICKELKAKHAEELKAKGAKKSEGLHEEIQDRACYTHSPNPHDIEELNKWEGFRNTLDNASTWDEVLQFDAQKPTPAPRQENARYEVRTGYGCCGAWMVGVKSPTGAPGLAQVLLQEISSLDFVKRRARMGAGMPARQDFYRYYGDRPVTGMEYLTWNELLMFLGSTARRRDRIYAPPYKEKTGEVKGEKPMEPITPLNDPARMHTLIHHAMTAIMQRAAVTRNGGSPDSIIAAAEHFTARLFEEASPPGLNAAGGQTQQP